MWRINSSAVVLILVVRLTTSSLAAEIQINEHTLCSTALHAFDAKDLSVILDFGQYAENVFKELDGWSIEGGERPVNKLLTDKSVAGPIVFGRCVQHPTATIYEEALGAYRSMRALSVPLTSEPAKLPPPSEGKPRFGK